MVSGIGRSAASGMSLNPTAESLPIPGPGPGWSCRWLIVSVGATSSHTAPGARPVGLGGPALRSGDGGGLAGAPVPGVGGARLRREAAEPVDDLLAVPEQAAAELPGGREVTLGVVADTVDAEVQQGRHVLDGVDGVGQVGRRSRVAVGMALSVRQPRLGAIAADVTWPLEAVLCERHAKAGPTEGPAFASGQVRATVGP